MVIIFGMFSSLFEFWSFSENPWSRDTWLACPPASTHDNGGEFLQFSKVWVLTGEMSVSDVRSTWVRTGFSFFFSTLLGLTDAGTEQTVWTGLLCLRTATSHSLLWKYEAYSESKYRFAVKKKKLSEVSYKILLLSDSTFFKLFFHIFTAIRHLS